MNLAILILTIILKQAEKPIIIPRVIIIWQLTNMTLQNTISVRNCVMVRILIIKMVVREAWHFCFKRHISQTPLPNMPSIVMR